MRILRFPALITILCLIAVSGCVSQQEYKDLKIRNDRQQERINQIQSELETTRLKLQQAQGKLQATEDISSTEKNALRQEIAALREDSQKKKQLIELMKEKLAGGGAVLPPELNTLLREFAASNDMVTFDSEQGMVKFKSDLLFEPGSANVASDASAAVGSLCEILQKQQAQQFDIIVAGHTDNMPIGRPSTRQKHPTNWHLSAHRAISVLQVMDNYGVDPERMSIRGFGKYRPVAPNQPNQGGNAQNRRVEIYIVPKGT